MARFTQPTDVGIALIGKQQSYSPEGGTLNGNQPTFSGSPGFYGIYAKSGDVISFSINVDFSNITNFGTGQYYMTIPFTAQHDLYFREGHLHDASSNKNYGISAHVEEGTNVMKLFYTASNGQDEAFTHANPVTLTTSDNFHIQGTYIDSALS